MNKYEETSLLDKKARENNTVININVYTGLSLIYWDIRTIVISLCMLLFNYWRKI